MRRHSFINGHYYHIYNRGVEKRDIFLTRKDINRFILSAKIFNNIKPVGSLRENIRIKTELDRIKEENDILVSIVCYCFNPNHFHFILKQETDFGISEFLKRLVGGYTTYFNKVYKRNGVLFQGKFKSKLIKDDAYFLKIRPYVNTNYLLHDIPEEKSHLVSSSCTEYDNLKFNLVSKKEALALLDFYGNNKKFKSECLKVVHMIRSERDMQILSEE
jgi:REP element-mobilizing transposase RayT